MTVDVDKQPSHDEPRQEIPIDDDKTLKTELTNEQTTQKGSPPETEKMSIHIVLLSEDWFV